MRRKWKKGIYTSNTIKSCRCKGCVYFLTRILDPEHWRHTQKIHLELHNRPHQFSYINSHGYIKLIFVKMLHRQRKKLIPIDFRHFIKEKRFEKHQTLKSNKKDLISDLDESLDYYSYIKAYELLERVNNRL